MDYVLTEYRLNEVRLLRLRILALWERIVYMRCRLERCTCSYSQATYASVEMEDRIIEILEKERALEEMNLAWRAKAIEAQSAINRIDDRFAKRLLKRLYIDCESEKSVCEKMGLTRRQFDAARLAALKLAE